MTPTLSLPEFSGSLYHISADRPSHHHYDRSRWSPTIGHSEGSNPSFDSDSTRYSTLPSLAVDTAFSSFDHSGHTPLSSFSDESPIVYPPGTFEAFTPHLNGSHMSGFAYSASDLYSSHSHHQPLRSAPPLGNSLSSSTFSPIDPLSCHDSRNPNQWNTHSLSNDTRHWDRYKTATAGGPTTVRCPENSPLSWHVY